jgi:hypothetical protein
MTGAAITNLTKTNLAKFFDAHSISFFLCRFTPNQPPLTEKIVLTHICLTPLKALLVLGLRNLSMGIKKANTMLALLYVPKFVGVGGLFFGGGFRGVWI